MFQAADANPAFPWNWYSVYEMEATDSSKLFKLYHKTDSSDTSALYSDTVRRRHADPSNFPIKSRAGPSTLKKVSIATGSLMELEFISILDDYEILESSGVSPFPPPSRGY